MIIEDVADFAEVNNRSGYLLAFVNSGDDFLAASLMITSWGCRFLFGFRKAYTNTLAST